MTTYTLPRQVQDLKDRLTSAGWHAGASPSMNAGDVIVLDATRPDPAPWGPRRVAHLRAVYHVTNGRARFYRATMGARSFSSRAALLKAADVVPGN